MLVRLFSPHLQLQPWHDDKVKARSKDLSSPWNLVQLLWRRPLLHHNCPLRSWQKMADVAVARCPPSGPDWRRTRGHTR